MTNAQTDVELSKIFGVKANTISTWKKRNTINYKRLIDICVQHEIALESLLEETATARKITLPVWIETQTM